jgi:Domain of unknown function (DUF1330)
VSADVIGLIEFPAQADALRYYNSPDYAPWREIRQRTSEGRALHLVEPRKPRTGYVVVKNVNATELLGAVLDPLGSRLGIADSVPGHDSPQARPIPPSTTSA